MMQEVTLITKYIDGNETYESGVQRLPEEVIERAYRVGAVEYSIPAEAKEAKAEIIKAKKPTRNKATKPSRAK